MGIEEEEEEEEMTPTMDEIRAAVEVVIEVVA